MLSPALPRVAVILAAFDGIAYLPAQLDSILAQTGIDVTVFVSVDQSQDGSEVWLQDKALNESKVRLLPSVGRLGSAAANFFRLLRDVCPQGFDYIAFADQDDIWNVDKLALACERMRNQKAHAYSSNAVAFWADGRSTQLIKAHQQRRFDHWFESAGPGCTYVLNAWVAKELSDWVRANWSALDGIEFHDWLIYAWVRNRGYSWWIDPSTTLQYRQHGHNVLGAHIGLIASLRRVRLLLNGWYFDQVLRMAHVCQAIQDNPLLQRLQRDTLIDRIALLRQVGEMRRARVDRVVLALGLLIGRRKPV